MDSMELEREKGITIQSAATYCTWGDNHVNIIDTPGEPAEIDCRRSPTPLTHAAAAATGHVDFTVEVERALRVLDGAVLVLCGVSGVQSQSITVDRQMKRYNVPRLAFINKLDRQGSNPTKVISVRESTPSAQQGVVTCLRSAGTHPFRLAQDLRSKLRLNAAAVQLPIGLEGDHEGVVDIIEKQAYFFKGAKGEEVEVAAVPAGMVDAMEEARATLIEVLADVDEEVGDCLLMDEEPSTELIHAAIRRGVISLQFVPVLMGSAFKNRGVQPLLDAVVRYLPSPDEVAHVALDRANDEEEVPLKPDPDLPLVALAFKLEESRFGQLTYFRIYQGTMKKGGNIVNVTKNQKIKVPRLVRMHSNEMQDVDSVGAGEIVATFGVECASGETFTDGTVQYGMTSMHVPEPVISYSVKPASPSAASNFGKALNRFQREDPTFRVRVDPESGETVISGMGELHLDIYVERMKREYKVDVVTGEPRVNYRETLTGRVDFNYLHKKQSGGAGQFARVIGHMEPMEDADYDEGETCKFVNGLVGNNVPPEYLPACKKGFEEAMKEGFLTGHPIEGVKFTLTDGADHPVDSSEMAFKLATRGAVRQAFEAGSAQLKEPIMSVEVEVPTEFQGTAIGLLNKRKGNLVGQDASDLSVVVQADVPLANMFGFSTDLRSSTQGKGEFSMEYSRHDFVMPDVQAKLVKKFQAERKGS